MGSEMNMRQNRDLQLNELEQTLAKESQRATDLKDQLTEIRGTLDCLQQENSSKSEEVLNLQKESERCKLEKEKLSCELAEISGRNLNNEQSLKSRNESLEKMVHLLESQLERTKEKLEAIEKEFESYKIRAQSVLRKEKESVVGAKAQEVAALERLTQSLNEKITELSTELSAKDLELRHVQEDHDRLMERLSALLSELASKERQSREKQEQLVKLASQAEKARQDAIASLQQQTEALKQTYRSQIEELESKHSAEVNKLQKQTDALDNQIIRLQLAAAKSGLHSPSNANEVVRYLEREAAEGSEGIETANARSTSTTPMDPRLARSVSQARSEPDAYSSVKLTPTSPLLPLEQLLMQQDPHDVSGTEVKTSKSIEELERRAVASERRVAHISSLLSEAELENSRLGELAAVLKEEIRSYQRSEERSKHIENLEYVKNIIVKFVTLPGSAEKSRLIPVLSTILRLSPAEVESIQKVVASDVAVAGSRAGTASETTVAAAAEGWTSYLGLWSN